MQRRTEALIGLLALIAQREGFGRVRPCRFEPPRTTLEQREVAGHVREACFVAGGARAFVDDPEQRARLVQLVGPDVSTRQRCRRAQVGHRNEAIALLAHGLAERRPPGSGLHAGVELGRRGERPDAQVSIPVVADQAERLLGAVPRLVRPPGQLQAERVREQAEDAHLAVVPGFRDRRATQGDPLLQPRVLVTADEHERPGVPGAGRQLLGGLAEELEGTPRVPRLLVALTRRHQAFAVRLDVLGGGEARPPSR